MEDRKTAGYKVLPVAEGFRFQFFCDLSGARACTTQPVSAETPEQALALAWDREGRMEFNHCGNCGRWVSDAMFNADVLECVACSPWEELPRYCPRCGKKLSAAGQHCPKCGAPLRYEGR